MQRSRNHLRALSLTALVVGAAIYVGGRPTSLRMFGWAEQLGLADLVASLRALLAPGLAEAPAWIVDSLPFALWVFALTLLLRGSAWVCVGPLLAVGAELGQLVGVVPGVFDPVDLALILAATALALVNVDAEHLSAPRAASLRPAIATGVFVLLAAGTSEDPEDKAEREQKEAVALDGLTAYFGQLAAIHTKLGALDLSQQRDQACDVKAMHALATVENKRLNLLSVRFDFLARFGGDKSAWTKNEGGWAFLTDSTFAGHFAAHNDDRDNHAVQDTAMRVQETFLPPRYLLVVMPTSDEMQVLPEMQGKQFDSGYFDGWVFVVDQTNADIACQYHITVQSSESIDFGGVLDSDDPDKEMFEDFEDNFEAAIKAALPGGIVLSSNYGSIIG